MRDFGQGPWQLELEHVREVLGRLSKEDRIRTEHAVETLRRYVLNGYLKAKQKCGHSDLICVLDQESGAFMAGPRDMYIAELLETDPNVSLPSYISQPATDSFDGKLDAFWFIQRCGDGPLSVRPFLASWLVPLGAS